MQGGTISARYDGTTYWFQANYDGGDGNDLVLTAIPVATTTTFSTSSASVTYGTQVTFTATVSAITGSVPPSGSVEFYDGSTDLGGGTAGTPSGGRETWTFTTLGTTAGRLQVGSGQTITAVYTPTANFIGSTGTLSGGETVMPATLTVLGINADDKTYDGTATVAVDPTAASLVGVALGDTVTLDATNALGTFASPEAANGITVTVSGLSLDGAQAADYVVAASTTANIMPVTLWVSGVTASDKVYNGTTEASVDAANAELEGVNDGDSVTLDTSDALGAFTSPDAGDGITVNVSGLSLDGSQANDYVLAATTIANITPKPLTVSVVAAHSKVYDGTIAATLNGTLDGVVGNDQVTAIASGTFDTSEAGSSITVTPTSTALVLTGPDAADYSLDYPLNTTITYTANITPATPSVTVLDNSGTYNGSAFTALGLTAGVVNGVDTDPATGLAGGNVTLTYYLGTTTQGSGSSVAPSDGGTYTVVATYSGSTDYTTAESAPLTFTISPVATSISLNASANSLILGQSLTLTTTVTADAAAGLTPGGTVTFFDGTTALDSVSLSDGTATLTLASLTAGLHELTAVYSGNADFAPSGTISTVAGNGVAGFNGDGGSAASAWLSAPMAVAVDADGDLFIADTTNNCIREVNHATGVITTVAGNGTAGFGGDNGPASAAMLSGPNGVAIDGSGNIYIADTGNRRIREVNLVTGVITTVAGNGTAGFGGDNGPASAAMLSGPNGVAIDSSGNLYIADASNNRIRKVDHVSGVITTVAGNGTAGFDEDNDLATAAMLDAPKSIAVDSSGNLYIGDTGNNRIREVDYVSGVITTVAGNGTAGFDGDNDLATAAMLDAPNGVAIDGSGNLYVADTGNNRIREINLSTGMIDTLAGSSGGYGGDDGPPPAAHLSCPGGVALDCNGNLFVADAGDNRIRELDPGAVAFVTVIPQVTTATTLSAASSTSGQGVTFAVTATVTAVPIVNEGSVAFYDLTTRTELATVAVDGTGRACYTSTTLSLTGHTITATYSDDPSDKFAGSTTSALVGATSPPTVATAAAANPGTVTSTSTDLSVLGADGGAGESGLTYTWVATALPAGAEVPAFSVNGSNAAKQTTVTFTCAGAYTLTATISDAAGLFTTSSVNVTVQQTCTTIDVLPDLPALLPGATQQFTAVGLDQFGNALTAPQAVTWNATTGTINATTGLYTAPTNPTVATVTATIGTITSSATTVLVGNPPTVATDAAATANPVTGRSTTLSVVGAYNDGESYLTYTWAATTIPSGAPTPTFSVNGSNTAKTTIVTFGAASSDDYVFTVTIADPAGRTATDTVSVTVDQTATTIQLSPLSASLTAGGTQQFTATADDQFGNPIATPTFTWAASHGRVNAVAGENYEEYTAPVGTLVDTITASIGAASGYATVVVTEPPPTVATAAAAADNPVTGASTTLSVTGAEAADNGGDTDLIYTWSAVPLSPGAIMPTFSFGGTTTNGTNGAKDATATFTAAGQYELIATITDTGGMWTTSQFTVTVGQTLTKIVVTPASAGVDAGGQDQFTAVAKDQFGQDLTQQPTFKWSTSAGKIDSKSGMFTAGTTSATATITATVDQTSAGATVTVTNQSPTVATVASATASPVIGTTTTLSVLGADDAGEANLSYSWVATPSSGAAMPTFSVNGTNAAKQTVATFTSAGEYEFTVTITDAGGRSTSSTVNVTVSQTATTITVNPSTASVPAGQTQSFNVSSCKDQFGQAMTTVPTFDWSCSAGSIAADGTFTAPEYSLPDTITAYSGNASGSAVVTITAVAPTMALRTGDSWVTGPWGGALGANETTQTQHLSQLSGTATLTLSTGFVVGPTTPFAPPSTFTPGESTTTTDPPPIINAWVSQGVTYSSTETDTSTLTIRTTGSVDAGWSYYEELDSGYTVTTTANGVNLSTASGFYNYTFTASGDASVSSIYTFGVEASATASGPYSSPGQIDGRATTIGGTWSQTSDNRDTIACEKTSAGVVSGSHSGGGATTWSASGSGTYSYSLSGGDQEGGQQSPTTAPTTQSDDGTDGYSYSETYSPDGQGGWTVSGTATNTTDDGSTATYGDQTRTATTNTPGESGSQTYSANDTTSYSFGTNGTWQPTGGGGTTTGGDETHSVYSNSGTYDDSTTGSSMTGTTQESGHDNTSSSYTLTDACSSGTWGQTGTKTERDWGDASYSYSGGGSYTDSTDGTINGTQRENGSDNLSYDYTTNSSYACASGRWQDTGGSGSESGSGNSHCSYAGKGSYDDSQSSDTMSGTQKENGADDTSYTFSTTGTDSGNGNWTYTGSQTETDSGNSHYSYAGSGSYTDSTGDGSVSGGQNESGQDDETYSDTTSYSLVAGDWKDTGGSGADSGSGKTHYDYTGSGSYDDLPNVTMSGSQNENGSDDTSYNFSITSTDSGNGNWSYRGTQTETDSGKSHYDYTGSGTYTDSTGDGSISGSQNESGQDDETYGYTTHYSLVAGDWQDTGGSGTDSGSGKTHYDYTGSGSYDDSPDITMSGSQNENGSDDTSYNFSITSTDLGNGNWSDRGTQTETDSGNSHSSYTGSGTYTDSTGDGSISGSQNESGQDDETYGYTTHYSLVAGDWMDMSGSGADSGSGKTHYSYDGSGSYDDSLPDDTMSGTQDESGADDMSYQFSITSTDSGGAWSDTGGQIETDSGNSHSSYTGSGSFTDATISGTQNENGRDDSSYNYTTIYVLVCGNWQDACGFGTDSGSGMTHYDYSGSGAYTDCVGSATVSGSVQESGHDNTSYKFNSQSIDTLGAWVDSSGSETDSASGGSNDSYSGSGTYSDAIGGGTIRGSLNQTGSDSDSYQETETSTIGGTGNWGTANGSYTESGTSDDSVSYSGSGTYQRSDATGNGSVNVLGKAQESGHDDQAENFSITGTETAGSWNYAGNDTQTDNGQSNYSYKGAGSASWTNASNGSFSSSWSVGESENGSGSASTNDTDGFTLAGGAWTQSSSNDLSRSTSDDKFTWNGTYSDDYYAGGRLSSYDNDVYHVNQDLARDSGASVTNTGTTTWSDFYGNGTATYDDTQTSVSTSGTLHASASDSWEKASSLSDNSVAGSWSETYNGGSWGSGHYGPEADESDVGFYSGAYYPHQGYHLTGIGGPPMTSGSGPLGSLGGGLGFMVEDTATSVVSSALTGQADRLDSPTPDMAAPSFAPASVNPTPSPHVGPRATDPAAAGLSGDAASGTYVSFDSAGQIACLTDANGGVTSFTHDSSGNLTSLSDPAGNTTTWTYNAQNQMVQEKHLAGKQLLCV